MVDLRAHLITHITQIIAVFGKPLIIQQGYRQWKITEPRSIDCVAMIQFIFDLQLRGVTKV